MKLFDDFARTDATPMRSSGSPSGHICPECFTFLNPDWTVYVPGFSSNIGPAHADWCTLGQRLATRDGERPWKRRLLDFLTGFRLR